MSARWYAVLAVLVAAVGVAGLAVADPTALAAAQYILLTAGGLLFLAAGGPNPVRGWFAWYELVGAGNVALGLVLPLGALTADVSSTGNVVYALATAAASLALIVIGLDYLRGGKWFDLPESLD